MVRNPWTTVPYTAAHVQVVRTMLGNIANATPAASNVTPEDKLGMVKVGDAQLEVNRKIGRVVRQSPNVMPRYHDINDYFAMLESVDNLLLMRNEYLAALEKIDNALSGAKDDSFRMSLDYYYSLKRAVKSSIPGLRNMYKEIRDSFIHETGTDLETQFPESVLNKEGANTPPVDVPEN